MAMATPKRACSTDQEIFITPEQNVAQALTAFLNRTTASCMYILMDAGGTFVFCDVTRAAVNDNPAYTTLDLWTRAAHVAQLTVPADAAMLVRYEARGNHFFAVMNDLPQDVPTITISVEALPQL